MPFTGDRRTVNYHLKDCCLWGIKIKAVVCDIGPLGWYLPRILPVMLFYWSSTPIQAFGWQSLTFFMHFSHRILGTGDKWQSPRMYLGETNCEKISLTRHFFRPIGKVIFYTSYFQHLIFLIALTDSEFDAQSGDWPENRSHLIQCGRKAWFNRSINERRLISLNYYDWQASGADTSFFSQLTDTEFICPNERRWCRHLARNSIRKEVVLHNLSYSIETDFHQ